MWIMLRDAVANYRKWKKVRRVNLNKNIEIVRPFFISNTSNLILDRDIYIGPDAWLSANGKIIIERGVIIGPRLKVYTSNHNYKGQMLPYDAVNIIENVMICENVWIGGDVIILPGVIVGEGSIVGAGSVVAKNIPPYSIAVGNPAKVIKERDIDEYNKLKNKGMIYFYHKNMDK